MKFQVDQPVRAPVDDVQAAFVDASFYASLGSLPGIATPELRSLERDGERAHLVVGYRFSGQLNGPARRILDPQQLSWALVSDVDVACRRTQVSMVPDHYGQLLSFSGWYELAGTEDGGCSQHFEAELRVHVPVLGPAAERALARSVRDNLAATASLVERWLRQGRGGTAVEKEA
ncbi:MAG TPA: DUF2505 family protein [Acidimicrobiales bacterium]|nr:DUF2505 family protein [Acidimicrobiales bacterium]